MSGARTNYHNSMCPTPGKIGGSDCIRHIICPASGKYAEIGLLRNA